jgi:hypothetical protein
MPLLCSELLISSGINPEAFKSLNFELALSGFNFLIIANCVFVVGLIISITFFVVFINFHDKKYCLALNMRNQKCYIVDSIILGIMSLIDYIRGEFVSGKVLDKYRLGNGNIGLLVEQKGTYKRYHVEFRDTHKKSGFENLYGLLSEPFNQKTKAVDGLINKGDSIELTVSYSRSPFRSAYRLHSTSKPMRSPNRPAQFQGIPYRHSQNVRYLR